MKIAVVGLWHLGTITALSLSKLNNLVYSFDEKKIVDQFNLNDPPVQENGVLKLLKKHKKKTKILQVGLSYKKNTSTIRRSIPYSLFNGLKKKFYIKIYDKYLFNHKNEVKNLTQYFLNSSSKEKFDLILIFSKLQNLNKIKENIKNNAKIIDFEGSNKKSILSKNLSYISLENE